MQIVIDAKTANFGNISDAVVVSIDELDMQFLMQASDEERLDWLDEVMESPSFARDASYLTAMLPPGVVEVLLKVREGG